MKKLLIFLLFANICNAQVLLEKESFLKKSNPVSTSKLDNIFKDNEITFYSIIEKESVNYDTNSIDRLFVLKDIDGHDYKLEKNEFPLNIAQNKLYTFIENVKDHERKYIVYDIKEKKLIGKSNLKLSLSSSVKILNSGDLIVSDGGHSGQDWMGLYSSDFKQIHNFKPFNTESWITSDANDDYIFFAAQIDRDPKIRVALYNTFGSKSFLGSLEIDIDADLILSSVKVFNNKIAMLFSSMKNSSTQILILDSNLEVIHKILFNERVAYNKILNIGDDIYINTTSSIYAYNGQSGVQNWVLKKEKSKFIKTDKSYRFKGTNIFVIDKNNILLTEGIYEDGIDEVKSVVLKIIDTKTKKIVQTIDTKTSFKGNLNYKNFEKEIVFYSNNKIISYEKL